MRRKRRSKPTSKPEVEAARPEGAAAEPLSAPGTPPPLEPEEPVERAGDTRAENASEETDIAPDLVDRPPRPTRASSAESCSIDEDERHAEDLDGSVSTERTRNDHDR